MGPVSDFIATEANPAPSSTWQENVEELVRASPLLVMSLL